MGLTMGMRVDGLPELQSKLRRLDQIAGPAGITPALVAGGKVIEAAAKENMGGPGPERRTGTLSRSSGVIPEGPATVSVAFSAPYARIQELGGHIVPKNATWLHWTDSTGEHFSKHVYLPPRPYLRPAFDEKGDEAIAMIGATIQRLIEAVA